jgi:hypothetical protein
MESMQRDKLEWGTEADISQTLTAAALGGVHKRHNIFAAWFYLITALSEQDNQILS